MHGEQLGPPEHIMLTEVAAVSAVAEDPTPTSFPSAEQPNNSAGQPNNNELAIDASILPATDTAECTTAWEKALEALSAVAGPISKTASEPASAQIHEIGGLHRDEVLVSAVPYGGGRLRAWLAATALLAAFCLGWFGGLSSHRFLNLSAALNTLPQTFSSSRTLGSEKITVTATESPASSMTAKTGSDAPSTRKPAASAAGTPDYPHKSSPGAARRAAMSPSTVSSVPQESTISPGPLTAQSDEKAVPRLTPVPDTRPVTIEGWTVRQVAGGTAVLEGPGGVFTATRGDTVPGVGRIDSIVLWGGRWIVATTKGLITTQ